jgi:hypothetical protein
MRDVVQALGIKKVDGDVMQVLVDKCKIKKMVKSSYHYYHIIILSYCTIFLMIKLIK